MENNEEIEIVKVDKTKIERLLKKVITLERTNLKTKAYNDPQMIKAIKKMIEEEVACY